MRNLRYITAFSLIELAVVLTIISLVVGAGISLGSSALKGADKYAVQERLAIIKKALNQFAQMNGYLPCPAERTRIPSYSAGYGFGNEARTGSTACDTAVAGGITLTATPGTYIGMIPVRTLGLPDSYARDPWGNKFTYAVASTIVANPGSYNAALTAGPVILYGDSAPNQVAYRPPVGFGTTYGTGYAAFVVISHGPSGVGAYPLNGATALGTCGTTADSENCDADTSFIDGKYNDGSQSAQFYDDYVVWDTNLRGLSPNGVNVSYRSPFATGFTSSTSPTGCLGSSGVVTTGPYCENWCAPCDTATPPLLVGSFTNPVLCSKVITASSSSSCTAKCVWGGVITTGTKYQPCP